MTTSATGSRINLTEPQKLALLYLTTLASVPLLMWAAERATRP